MKKNSYVLLCSSIAKAPQVCAGNGFQLELVDLIGLSAAGRSPVLSCDFHLMENAVGVGREKKER